MVRSYSVADVDDDLRQRIDLAVREPGRRLVEHQQLRFARQTPGEFDPLQRAVRQAGALMERDVGETEVGEDGVRLLVQAAFLLASAEVEHRGEERLLGTGVDTDHDVLDHRHPGPQRQVLERAEHTDAG